MKCPKCGFNSFNYLENCKRCNAPLNPEVFYEHQIKSSLKDENSIGGSEIDLSDYVSDLPESYKKQAVGNMSESLIENDQAQNDHESEFTSLDDDKFKNVFDKLEDVELDSSEKYEELETVIIRKRKGFLANLLSFFNRGKNSKLKNLNSENKTVVLYNFASIEARLLAFLVDWILIIFLSLTAFVFGIRQVNLDYSYDFDSLFVLLVKVFLVLLFFASTYFVFLLGYSGTTIGKMLLKIKVVIKEDGSDIGFYESTKRWLGYLISTIPLFVGFFWAVFDESKQSFHDKIAKTVVIKA